MERVELHIQVELHMEIQEAAETACHRIAEDMPEDWDIHREDTLVEVDLEEVDLEGVDLEEAGLEDIHTAE